MHKGSVISLLVIAVTLFSLGFGLYISYYILDELDTQPLMNATTITIGKTAIQNLGLTFPLIAIIWGATAVALAWSFGGSPIMYVFSTLVTGFIMIVAAQLSDTFEILQGYFPASTINALPFVGTINLNLPLYVLCWAVLVVIATHRGGSEEV